MSDKRYTEEFKQEATKQITERGHSVADVASRFGVTTNNLYAWLNQPQSPHQKKDLREQGGC
jgi:transposase